MAKLFNITMVGAVAFLLVGCSEPTVDASSDDAFYQSTQAIHSSLDGERKEAFSDALAVVTMGGIDMRAVFAGQAEGEFSRSIKTLDGLTAEEVIAEAEELHRKQEAQAAEQRQAQREEIRKEIHALEAKQQAAQEAQAHLKRFEVRSASFNLVRDRYGNDEPFINLTVANHTYRPISRVYFHGELISRGRSVPWISEPFNYEIPGGMEPGEVVRWKLAPNRYSVWGTTDFQAPADLNVRLTRLDGPNGEPLWDARGLSEREQLRLKRLREELESL